MSNKPNLDLAVIPQSDRRLVAAGFDRFPAPIIRAGEKAAYRFLEFFTANIRNKNTRRAYARAVQQCWCRAVSKYW